MLFVDPANSYAAIGKPQTMILPKELYADGDKGGRFISDNKYADNETGNAAIVYDYGLTGFIDRVF